MINIRNIDQQHQTVLLGPLKMKIDDKINRILAFLEDDQYRNAQETEYEIQAHSILKANTNKFNKDLEQSDRQTANSINLDCTRNVLSDVSFQKYLPQNINQVSISHQQICKQNGKLACSKDEQQTFEQNYDDNDSQNQFMSVKVSEDGSLPDMWIYDVKKEEDQAQQHQQRLPYIIAIKNCESYSQHEGSYYQIQSILQVPEQQEDDQDYIRIGNHAKQLKRKRSRSIQQKQLNRLNLHENFNRQIREVQNRGIKIQRIL